MRRIIQILAVIYVLNGLYMLIMPFAWYENTPGVSMLGPYNTHFVRDVGLVYLISAAGMFWGVRPRQVNVLIFASIWPALHAIYHFWMWIGRDFAFDQVALVNLIGIQIPAWLTLFIAMRMRRSNWLP